MISRTEFLGFNAALAAAAGTARAQTLRPQAAGAGRKAPSAAEREAQARENTPHKAGKVMAMDEAGLIGILKDDSASEFEKAKACQRLATLGGAKAVPVLAALLPDPKLSHYARYALEPIPGPEADAALREALSRLEGNLLIGVINSTGRRQDSQALAALAKLRHHADQAVAEAASAAIARIRRP